MIELMKSNDIYGTCKTQAKVNTKIEIENMNGRDKFSKPRHK
jgi:hypothetical protein